MAGTARLTRRRITAWETDENTLVAYPCCKRATEGPRLRPVLDAYSDQVNVDDE